MYSSADGDPPVARFSTRFISGSLLKLAQAGGPDSDTSRSSRSQHDVLPSILGAVASVI